MPEPKRPSLTVLGGPKAGSRFPLDAGEYLLGSDKTCVFQLSLPGVSPTHARLVVADDGVTIHDAGGRGLHVNDTRVGPAGELLRNGDIVWLGTPGEADVVMLQCILPGRPAPAREPDAPTVVAKAKPSPPVEHAAPIALPPPAEPEPLAPPVEPTAASEMDDVEAELASAEAVPFIPEPSPPSDLLIEGTAVEAEPILAEPMAEEAASDYVPEEGGFTTEPSFPVGVPAASSVIVEEGAPLPPVEHPQGPRGLRG